MEEDQEVLSWIEDYFSKDTSKKNLICVLLALQENFGYLPKHGMRAIAAKMDLSPANVFGVASFYNQFRMIPPGKHPIKVCLGTACHIKQASKVLEHFERRLEIREGEVSDDREYSLDRVACVGCCTLAPVVLDGDDVIGDVSPSKIDGILLKHEMNAAQDKSGSDNSGKDESS
jgi:NADH-quinone oxidoreductase subunit E